MTEKGSLTSEKGMEYNIEHRILHFKQPAGTSRGVYTTRDVWHVTLSEKNRCGIGECAPLPDLSCDAYPLPEYEEYLHAACRMTCQMGRIPYEMLYDYPSILFGLECAMQQLHAEGQCSPFEKGEIGIPINGLIWMGSYTEMLDRIEEKLQKGYRCVKVKIGAINFEDEVRLLERIRKEYGRKQIELRVDANGGFSPQDALHKLQRLSQLDLHSIEQPIKQGQWREMAHLCRETPLPIALDEELIGVNERRKKEELLDTIRPQYIILKPSLHGGIRGCEEWIEMAEERGIGWWATSALESNIGLAAIARWCAKHNPSIPQGLGTGLLFTDNTPAQTEIRGDELWHLPQKCEK